MSSSRALLVGGEIPALDRAAIILVALDDERAQRIFAQLGEEEIRRVSRAMARLGRAEIAMVEETITGFRDEVTRTGSVAGTVEGTERLLLRFMPPDRVADIMSDLKGPDNGGVWEKLAGIPATVLASYLRQEYPQTVAVVVARLPAEQAAKVLQLLPESVAAEVALRIVRLDSIQPSVLTGIEATLERAFGEEMNRSGGPDSAVALAELLNNSASAMVEQVMAALDAREPDIAKRVRKLMFGFADLARVERASFGMLIAECPADKLAVALSAAGPALRELFLANMSERAGKILREEIETMPTQRKKIVDEAQADLVTVAKRLLAEGKIFLVEDDGADADADAES